MSELKTVFYKDFGAVGDGVTDDFDAIKAAHEYANREKLPVSADEGKKYYIGAGHGKDTITVKTSTNWQNSAFIIDDRFIEAGSADANSNIFTVASDYSPIKHNEESELVRAINNAGGIKTTDTSLPYKPGHTVMLIPYNKNHRVYIRYGINNDAGDEQHEVMIVDGEGNIDKNTPALLDYEAVTSVTELRIDDGPIELVGGSFLTRANQAPSAYRYFSRGICIRRSNVTVRKVKHSITDEGEHGAPYIAFISVYLANKIICEDCTLQAHRYYYNADPTTGGASPMGTYELSISNSNDVLFKNCNQSNYYDLETGKPTKRFFDKDGKPAGEGIWGVMGSNYSKNIVYDGCKLNRYDAHAGVYNAVIRNCETVMINLIGGGTAIIENSIIHNYTMITLRSDYGSFWNGDVVIRNTKYVTESKDVSLMLGEWVNHNFGYKTSLPNVYIDGLTVEAPSDEACIFNDFTAGKDIGDFSGERVMIDGEEVENKNPMSMPSVVSIKNVKGVKLSAAPVGSVMNKIINVN